MRKKTGGFLAFLFVLFLLNSFVYAQNNVPGNQKSFLWKVQSKTGAVYILGSVHFLKKDMYPLSSKIEDSFQKADALVVEANVNEANQNDMDKLMKNALYPETDTIEKHLSKETYELLKAKTNEFNMPSGVINRQKPWFLSLMLSSMELMKLGFDPNLGIDKYFLLKATGKKKILELESLDYQTNLFNGFSDNEQELLLLYTLKDLSIMEQEIDKLIRAWTSGDAKGMETILLKSLTEDQRLSTVYEKLIYERNRNMVYKIEEFLKNKDTYFVVVGAGHLVGKEGIIELLKAKKYAVEQM